MGDYILPVTREEGILQKLRSIFGEEAQIQEGDIRVEHVLKTNDVSHRFNLNGDGVTKRPLEVFIGRNDLVVISQLKVCLNKVNKTGTDGSTAATSGNSPDYTYPDKGVFSQPFTAANVSESQALMAFYAGNITMKANTVEVLNQMQLRRFYVVPETQFSAETMSQLNQDGYVDFVQPYILSGNDTNIMEFEPAAGADTEQIGGEDGTENVGVFAFKVFVVRNGAQSLTNTQAAEVLKNLGKKHSSHVLNNYKSS